MLSSPIGIYLVQVRQSHINFPFCVTFAFVCYFFIFTMRIAKVGENTFLALVTIDGVLTRVSVQLRLNLPPAVPSPVHIVDSATSAVTLTTQLSRSNTSSNGSINGYQSDEDGDQQPELFCEVAAMSGPKCGLGVAEWNGKLLVCGGYDRGECLRCVESYDPQLNGLLLALPKAKMRASICVSTIHLIISINSILYMYA